jgi:hypothetical protein
MDLLQLLLVDHELLAVGVQEPTDPGRGRGVTNCSQVREYPRRIDILERLK